VSTKNITFAHNILDAGSSTGIKMRAKVGHIGILSDLTQGDPLTPTSNQQRNMGLL